MAVAPLDVLELLLLGFFLLHRAPADVAAGTRQRRGGAEAQVDGFESRGQRVVEHHEVPVRGHGDTQPYAHELALGDARRRRTRVITLVPPLDADAVVVRTHGAPLR